MSRIKKFKWGDTVYDVGPNKTSELQNDSGFLTEDDVGVDDVKVNNASIVDENKVANVKIGPGLELHPTYGIQVKSADITPINNRYGGYCVESHMIDYAVKAALTDGKGPAYTTEEQTAARERFGIIIPTKTSDLTNDAGFLTENEAVTKTATGTQTIKSALFLGGVTSDVGFGNAITHQRKLDILDPQGRTVYGAGFQVGFTTGACELITKTWDDAGANAYNTAVLRMSPNGLSFAINGAPSRSHSVPTEAEYKKVAIADDLSLNKSGGDLILKHGTTTVSTLSGAIPTKTSDLTNDSGFITSTSLPTKVSDLLNDSGFLTTANIATSLTPGVIKSGYQLNVASDGTPSCGTLTKTSYASANTASFVSKGTLDNILTDYALSSEVPVKISDLTNDSGFITNSSFPTSEVGGVIKVDGDYAITTSFGYLMAATKTYDEYPSMLASAFISKGTLNYVLGNYYQAGYIDEFFVSNNNFYQIISGIRQSIPTDISDLNNDSGFVSLPWYYQTEGPSVDASVKINTIITTYGKVVLGPGTYYLKNNIVLRTGQSIEGTGLQTILKWDSDQSSSGNIIYILSNTSVSTVDRIYVKNLCISGIKDSEVASLIDYTSSSIPEVIRGIDSYSSNTDNGTITKDHPLVIEDVVFENLSYGIFDRLSSGYESNPSMGSTDYEPITDRLIIRNCTFRNCYRSYYEDRSESYPSGMVRVENCIFNKFREAIRVKHMGFTISNCSFYHSYYRSISTSSGVIDYFDNIPTTVHNCRFYAPCVDNVMHISFNLIGTKEPLIVVSDSFFEFGKLNNTAYRHIYSSSRMIINNCNFKMRAIGSVNNNLIQFAITRVNKATMIMNSITDTNVVSLGSPINIVNSFKDDGSSFLAS